MISLNICARRLQNKIWVLATLGGLIVTIPTNDSTYKIIRLSYGEKSESPRIAMSRLNHRPLASVRLVPSRHVAFLPPRSLPGSRQVVQSTV